MSSIFRGSTCKLCGKKYHICGSCGPDVEEGLFELWQGFCSSRCMDEVYNGYSYDIYSDYIRYWEDDDDDSDWNCGEAYERVKGKEKTPRPAPIDPYPKDFKRYRLVKIDEDGNDVE